MPSLQPEGPDGFFMFLIQMGMAQREVDVLAQRTADGMEAKLRAGGWPHKAPEGYTNKERLVSSNKYERWVEADSQFIPALKDAWQMLLTDRFTLDDICEELNKRGYVRSSGRPWAWDDPRSGSRKTARNRLHEILRNPFYAGWVASERFDIKMGDVRGQWEPVVTTEQFERGKVILLRHGKNKSNFKRHHYLLRNLLYVQAGKRQYKMYGSTPTGRSRSYTYYNTHARPGGKTIWVDTNMIDQQIPAWLAGISIDLDLLPHLRETYQTEIRQATKEDHEQTLAQLKRRMSELLEEETRIARLMITRSISNAAYKQLRDEWQEKKINVQCKIDELRFDARHYLDNLDIALALLSSMSTLYERLDEKQKVNLLQIIADRIIISPQGEIIDHKLHSPFAYLISLASQLNSLGEEGSGSKLVRLGA